MKNHLNDSRVLLLRPKKPEIYLICKATYQKGHIHGIWIDARHSIPDILKRIAIMLHESCNGGAEMLSEGYYPDPNTYAIHCHLGFYDLKIEDNAKIENVRSYALFIAEYSELGAELINLQAGDLKKAKKLMKECYLGEYESKSAYAREFFNQHYLPKIRKDLPFSINYKYINYEYIIETLFMLQGFFVEVDGKTHAFRHLKKSESNTKAA